MRAFHINLDIICRRRSLIPNVTVGCVWVVREKSRSVQRKSTQEQQTRQLLSFSLCWLLCECDGCFIGSTKEVIDWLNRLTDWTDWLTELLWRMGQAGDCESEAEVQAEMIFTYYCKCSFLSRCVKDRFEFVCIVWSWTVKSYLIWFDYYG